jgi:uncharacterized protein (DUF433 family)
VTRGRDPGCTGHSFDRYTVSALMPRRCAATPAVAMPRRPSSSTQPARFFAYRTCQPLAEALPLAAIILLQHYGLHALVSQPWGLMIRSSQHGVSMSVPEPLITSSPDRLSGTPVFAGTRVPVQTLLDYLEGGDALDDFLLDFPSVSREHAIAVLEAAKSALLAKALAA